MASRESDLHDEIKKGFRPLHGRAVKISDRHTSGIVDLSCTCPNFGQFWLELKFERMPKRAETAIKVGLTKLQREFIKDEQEAGGKAGWLLCVKVTPRLWFYWVSTDYDVESVEQGTHMFVRKTGELTNVGRIAEVVVRGNSDKKFGRHEPSSQPKTNKHTTKTPVRPRADRVKQAGHSETADRPVVRRASPSRFG